MKNLLYILVFCSLASQAQNNVSISYQFIDAGFGLKYERIIKHVGIYAGAAKGSYRFPDSKIRHEKAIIGVSYSFNEPLKSNGFFSAGAVFHRFGEDTTDNRLDPHTFDKTSFEVGFGNRWKYVSAGVRIDIMKREAALDIGFIF